MPSHWVLVISRNSQTDKQKYLSHNPASLTQMLAPIGNNSNEISFLQGCLSIPKGQSHAQQMDSTQ